MNQADIKDAFAAFSAAALAGLLLIAILYIIVFSLPPAQLQGKLVKQ